MAYQTPQFPINLDVYRWSGAAYVYVATYDCAYRAMDRNGLGAQHSDGGFPIFSGLIYVPAGTDIRSDKDGPVGTVHDMVVVPSGGTSSYQVNLVTDQAKGFPNEFRVLIVSQFHSDVYGPHS